jgi:acetylglutamate kinase
MKKITIVKVGGAVVEDPSALEAFLDSFCSIPGAKILIHGGGRAASDMSARLGLPVIMKDGRRITDA